jgi:hypothetical protein
MRQRSTTRAVEYGTAAKTGCGMDGFPGGVEISFSTGLCSSSTMSDVLSLAAEFGAEASETKLRQMLGEPAGGGEVAPRAPASSSTLRLELIVETP